MGRAAAGRAASKAYPIQYKGKAAASLWGFDVS